MPDDRKVPDIIDADPSGGWDEVGDEEAQERNAAAREPADAPDELDVADAELLVTDAVLQPDDPIEGEAARRGADPDLGIEPDRGEEP